MAFRTQRIANGFPTWTKIRRDPSSFGQRFLSVFADYFDQDSINTLRISQELSLTKPILGHGYLYTINLEEEDEFPLDETSLGRFKYLFPTVVATKDSTDYSLTKYDDLQSLLYSAPDRITQLSTTAFTQYLVWASSASATYNALPRPERLVIVVDNSTNYLRSAPGTDLLYSGNTFVRVTGTDENDIEFIETVPVIDDNIYWTRNIFKEVTEVIPHGFNGTVNVYWFADNLDWENDPYRVLVFDDYEGPLKLQLSTSSVSGTTYSFLTYLADRLKVGEEYRRTGLPAFTDSTEDMATVTLLDSAQAPYTAVDMALSHFNGKVYVLDDLGRVHVYEHILPSFTPFSDTSETNSAYIELLAQWPYVKYGDSESIFTRFQRPRYNIANVVIKRVAPDGTIRYLQSNKTWGVASYSFEGDMESVLPESSWTDFSFDTTYDQAGQWEYYCTVETLEDTTTYVTAVYVGQLVAEATLATNVTGPTALDFSKEGWLAVSDGSDITYFQEHIDGWYADTALQRVFLRESYDSVEVTY